MNSAVNLLQRKANGLVRAGMVHGLAGPLGLYTINEYPKSGGTWVGQMLGRALGLPFPRNGFPVLRPSIMHGHYLNPWGMRNVACVWRDGRDVMVSWYHHCLFPNERGNAPLVQEVRRDLPFEDYEDVRGNLPAFIEYCFTRQRRPHFSWDQFVSRWHGHEGAVHVRYEDLRRDTPGELGRLARELTGRELPEGVASAVAEEFSFERQAGRRIGEENKGSFMRKGIIGDWRNQFGPEAREVFDRHAGDALVSLGYEKDHLWAKNEDAERATR